MTVIELSERFPRFDDTIIDVARAARKNPSSEAMQAIIHCALRDPETFFLPQHQAEARANCERCAGQAACLGAAIEWPVQHGYRGGFTAEERTILSQTQEIPNVAVSVGALDAAEYDEAAA